MVHSSKQKGVQAEDITGDHKGQNLPFAVGQNPVANAIPGVSTKAERGTSPSSTMSVPASKRSSLTHSASSTRTSSPESCTKCASFVTSGLPPSMSPNGPFAAPRCGSQPYCPDLI